ncbi:hypothetical protein WR25_02420 [Diploscapter pachys]|uniref:Rap-GAP domain-containing protein n=1 Tax=Diploscapter pachys TaxID=2018661 RepID=A0A2A2KKL5_9BILA|nr:hypothetical protein WR25_02420 [Diploscapter pachys]
MPHLAIQSADMYVISGLSLASVDLDDCPEAMMISPMSGSQAASGNAAANSMASTGPKRSSIGSSSSSMAGDSTSLEHLSSGPALSPTTCDGISAGRAAALSALLRIVCSKSSNEKLSSQQLSAFYATLYQALIEKNRVVLCALFFYGRNLFRLGLPEFNDSSNLKSSAPTYLHLRARIYKTLVFSLRNETDPINLHITLAMCTVLMEESCSFDLGLNDEQTKEMIQIVSASNGSAAPEKGLCVSFVRGFVSAVCDRLARAEWTGDHSVSLAAIDLLNALARVHPTVLFNNKDVSTGSLIVASLCRFIETQLMKPPPMHSKDLHSTVVAAYVSIAVWLNAAPILAECEGVLQTVAEAVQLGVTGSKKPDVNTDGTKAASKRVYEAAEYLMYSLFCLVGRPLSYLNDEKRLQHKFGSNLIDSSKFVHFLVNGDTLLSLHEASHILPLTNVGVACLRPYPVGYHPDSPHLSSSMSVASSIPPSTPQSIASGRPSVVTNDDAVSTLTQSLAGISVAPSAVSECTLPSLLSSHSAQSSNLAGVQEENRTSPSTLTSSNTESTPVGSIISGLPKVQSPSSPSSSSATATTGSANLTPSNTVTLELPGSGLSQASRPASGKPPPPPTPSLGKNFVIPPDFHKQSCRLDSIIRDMTDLRPTEMTNRILRELDEGKVETDSVWRRLSREERGVTPPEPVKTCDSIRIFLYDFGLLDESNYGTSLKYLDSSNSDQFYADLHDAVDCAPSRSIQTAHIFYVKEGQRSPIDILDNALNIQNTSADFCSFLNGLGEGITIGVHDTWTGHWSTAFSNERRPLPDPDPVDHYLLDGVTHALWHSDGDTEVAFLMPTERSMRIFKQQISHQAISARRGNAPPSRRSSELRLLLVWLEKPEDMAHFPIDELLCICDDGGDKQSSTGNSSSMSNSREPPRPAHLALFLSLVEPGLVQIRTSGSPNRFGEALPLIDGVVVSQYCLSSFIRLTLLNISRRNVAEIENFHFNHTKRKIVLNEFANKYKSALPYEQFIATKLLVKR